MTRWRSNRLVEFSQQRSYERITPRVAGLAIEVLPDSHRDKCVKGDPKALGFGRRLALERLDQADVGSGLSGWGRGLGRHAWLR
ncbi:hypothetical protein XcvCFBP7113P_11090 [Xanthomonas citri pv. vignicola]|nr:hypothetical protein XcvCFBP7113P_11090 [Xanthomonas citri pv. vignicola]